MALMVEKLVPNYEPSAPGAFPSEMVDLPYHKDMIEYDRLQDLNHQFPEMRTSVVAESTGDKARLGLEEKEWLQRLDDLEAQPVYNKAEPVLKKPQVSFCEVLTQRQRELMDEAEVLDVMEKGELVCSR